MTKNRHPIDELADLRAEKKKLEQREEELREKILTGDWGLVGDQFEATVSKRTQTRLDPEAVYKLLSPEQAEACQKEVQLVTIKIAAREVLEDVG